MLRILVADDHGIVRSGLKMLIERHDTMSVVAEAEDVAILDVAMPRMTGIQAAREIRAHCPDTAVLLLSMYDDERYVHDALRAGASGYVLKRQADAELIEAVHAVAAGGRFVSQLPGTDLGDAPADPLTPRELDVVKLIAEAYTNRQIASILKVSEKTVESHRSNVFSKLGMRDRVELVRYAIKRGLVEP
jgi:DNA-binding NarL/FixJ family response regulator